MMNCFQFLPTLRQGHRDVGQHPGQLCEQLRIVPATPVWHVVGHAVGHAAAAAHAAAHHRREY